MKEKCNHKFVNDGGNGLVCEKCGMEVSVRLFSVMLAVSMVYQGVINAPKMQFRQVKNLLINALCCILIGWMKRYSALDMIGVYSRKRNALDNDGKESGYETGFVKLVKWIWGF